ncbi:MAG: DUF998 domain-containing protein [Pasteurellaceae bacterium]|nr:DUF998 domain-containing protein [Pasteurellaceae bacterium]
MKRYLNLNALTIQFYPLLMHPCIRHSHTFFVRTFAVLSVFIGLYFLFAELIAILFSRASLSAYLHHTLFELSVPNGSIIDDRTVQLTPLSFSVRASFLLQGYLFALIYFVSVMRITQGFRLIAGALALAFSFCMGLIYSAQGGQYTVGGLQNLGVSITFILGNLIILLTAFTTHSPLLTKFKMFSLLIGGIGLVSIIFTMITPTPYLPILERLGIYSILFWEIAVGFAVLKQVAR